MNFLNWKIISEPWNWIIVMLMVIIAFMAFDIFSRIFNPTAEETA